MYEIGTSGCRLPNLCSRNQLTICKESFVKVEDLHYNLILPLREVALLNSDGQGVMIDVRVYKNANAKLRLCT